MKVVLTALYKETSKNRDGKYDSAVELVTTILRNIVENSSDEKYRTFKRVSVQTGFLKCLCLQENPKIKEKLTKYKAGIDLIKLLGFMELKDEQTGDFTFRINSQVSISFLKVRSQSV